MTLSSPLSSNRTSGARLSFAALIRAKDKSSSTLRKWQNPHPTIFLIPTKPTYASLKFDQPNTTKKYCRNAKICNHPSHFTDFVGWAQEAISDDAFKKGNVKREYAKPHGIVVMGHQIIFQVISFWAGHIWVQGIDSNQPLPSYRALVAFAHNKAPKWQIAQASYCWYLASTCLQGFDCFGVAVARPYNDSPLKCDAPRGTRFACRGAAALQSHFFPAQPTQSAG